MSTLRGFVYRSPFMLTHPTVTWTYWRPWVAYVGRGSWTDRENHAYAAHVGSQFATQPEALAAVCQRLKDEALVGDIVRRAEGKEEGA